MAQRRTPPKKGSVITFKFQELSNAGIPRFPVFLRLRSDMTWNDVLESAKTKTPISVTKKVVPTAKLSKQHSILFSDIPVRDTNASSSKTKTIQPTTTDDLLVEDKNQPAKRKRTTTNEQVVTRKRSKK